MGIKLGGSKGAVKRTYSSRALGGATSVSQSEGTTRSSVNPTNETGDRDSYEGSGTGYRKTIHDQLEALQATEILRVALEEAFNTLKTHLEAVQQTTDPQRQRYHQHEFNNAREELDVLTQPQLWEDTAVMRIFVGLGDHLVLPEGLTLQHFSPRPLDLYRINWDDPDSLSHALDQLDTALDLLESLTASTHSARQITEAAMASMPHGRSARLSQTQVISNATLASKTAQWLRSAMLADGRIAVQVQASKLSHQALHLVG
jgi:hypothetical protein